MKTPLFIPIIVSLLFPLFLMGQDKHTIITFEKKHLDKTFYNEGANFADLNKDGHNDLISGPFWYEGPGFETRHEYYEPKPFSTNGYSDNFFIWINDFNRDTWPDILLAGFPGQEAFWFENPKGEAGHWNRHLVAPNVDNESPHYGDLTGDGEPELVYHVNGEFGFAGPDYSDPAKPWEFVKISGKATGGRFEHGLGVGDINGDGKPDLLERTGWWENPGKSGEGILWKEHEYAFSPSASQIIAYDVDDDGDNDVITSLSAHGWGFAWHEQIKGEDGGIDFKRHMIMGATPSENPYGVAFSQTHAVDLIDIDGDGVKDVVTGKRYFAHQGKDPGGKDPAVLYWFKISRGEDGVEFIPHLIDDDSGVGVQVVAGNINDDDLPDIVVGNKKGTFVLLQQRKEVSEQEYLEWKPKKTVNEGLQPEEAAATMTVPEGFEVKLIAGEPRLHQPVALTTDRKGRIWVAEAFTYPQRAPEGEGKDNIAIFEDKDGDGEFETRKTFIEGLNLVSGIEVGFGGVWVGAAPYLLFIPDADGDDKPDGEPEILLDGWGYQDTHETLNAFNWGPDGWLYGCQGVFTHSRVGKPGTPDAERIPLNACVWRYHPTRHEFEVFAHGTSNPWGVDFDDMGQAFITACVIPHFFHMIQGGRYQRQGGQHFNPYTYDDIKTIADHLHYKGNIRDHAWWGHEPKIDDAVSDAGGGHAHCGAMVYLGDDFPEEYRNTVFFNNIHGNRVNRDIPERRGSGYVARHGDDFLMANDFWYRGINLRYGPDGGVYFIDWYDENACHRTRPEIWNRTNGRLYKVTYGKDEPVKVDLDEKTDEELVRLHLHKNDWYVRMARKILMERATERQLTERSRQMLVDMARNDENADRRLRALWTIHAIDPESPSSREEFYQEMLEDENEFVRSWAIQFASEDNQVSVPMLRKMLALAKNDNSQVVRLYLASALQRIPADQRWSIADALLAHGQDAEDHNLPLMYWYAVEPLVPQDLDKAMMLASRSKVPLVTRFITRRAASERDLIDGVIESLTRADDPQAQELILAEMVNAIKGEAQLPMPDSWGAAFDKLMKSDSQKVQDHAIFIATKFGDDRVFPRLRGVLADASAPLDRRENALNILLAGKDKEVAPILLDLLEDDALRSRALKAVASFNHPDTATAIIDAYDKFSADEKQDAVSTLASRPAYAKALLRAIDAGKVPQRDVHAFTVRQMTKFGDEEINRMLNDAWGKISDTSANTLKQIEDWKAKLTPQAMANANLIHGREMFQRTCASCHVLFGTGGKIGPDLTGSNRANLDYILENIVDPNAVVGLNYQMTIVQTKDGRVLAGMVESETDTAYTLRLVNDAVVVAKDDVKSMEVLPNSLMPPGLLATMKESEVRDMIAYLASPSQVPLPSEAPVIDPATGVAAGVLEGEKLQVLAGRGNSGAQNMGNFPDGQWSGTSHLWWTAGRPGATLELGLPAPEAGMYEIYVVMTKARDYGIVQHLLNGRLIGPKFDLYSPNVVNSEVISLGEHELKEGRNVLTVRIEGANPQAVKSYMYGLDFIKLAPRD